LQLEKALAVIVEAFGCEQVSIIVYQSGSRFGNHLQGCPLREIKVGLVSCATVEIGGNVASVIQAIGGKSGHREVNTRQHAVGTVARHPSCIGRSLRQVFGCIFQVADGKLYDIHTRVGGNHVIVHHTGGVGIDDAHSP
jgi:hypothetical protein